VSPALVSTLFLLGFVGAFIAGLIGVGGGVVTFPLLLYVPPLLGVGVLDPKAVAAIAVTQVLFACISGALAHGRSGQVSRSLAVTAGLFTTVGAFVGGVASKALSPQVLLGLFGVVTALAAVMIMLPGYGERAAGPLPVGRTAALSLVVGGIVGILGAGNFLFIPLAVLFLRVPFRLAIGTNLVLAGLSSFAGFVGKAITGQVPFLVATVVVLGALPGAQAGEWVCRRVNTQALRVVYAVVVGLVAVRIWLSILVF
jgi:uncharacterized membrane protein YfcA